MKILFFIHSLDKGGAERVLSVLANYLIKFFQIEICYFDKNLNFYEFNKNIEITKLKKTKFKNKFLAKIDHILNIRKKIISTKPDLIISFMDFTNFDVILANFKFSPLIVTEHVNYKLLKSPRWIKLRKFLYPFASFLSVLTKEDKSYYEKFVKNVAIMPNPVDFKIEKNPSKKDIILVPARLEEIKDHATLFKALRLIDLKNFKVILAGGGSLKDELKKKSKGLNVEFIGHQKELEKFYKVAKILVLPSKSEGFSNVLVESMFFSVARLSSKTAGGLELIKDNENGLLFEIGDEKDLANKLEKLINDDNLREKLAKNSLNEAKNFSILEIGKRWDNLIKEVLNAKT